MLFSDIPFTRLRTLLLDLGFLERVIDGSHLGFYHAETDTLFTFRLYRAQDKVSMMDLIGVRSQLDCRGLLNQEKFDHALRRVSA
jgi:hypothetical protein